MSSIRNKERTLLFPLLSIDIDKSRGRWRVFVGDVRVGKTYLRKVEAVKAARKIRRSWMESMQDAERSDLHPVKQIEKHFLQITDGSSDHPFG
jgi:hypothetical protein